MTNHPCGTFRENPLCPMLISPELTRCQFLRTHTNRGSFPTTSLSIEESIMMLPFALSCVTTTCGETSLLNHSGVWVTVLHPRRCCQGCRRATPSKVRPPSRHGQVIWALEDVTHSLLCRIGVLCTLHSACLDHRSATHPAMHCPHRCRFPRGP